MSAEARFAVGDWYAVVGDHVTVLLPGSQRGRVAELWDLADAGADSDAVLDALLAGGLSSLDHFALVAHSDESTRLLVRGAPTATVSSAAGDDIISAAPGTTWNEQVLTGVASVRVTLTGGAAVEHLLTPGLSRVSVVEFGTPSAAGAPAADEAGAPEAPAPPAEPAEPVLAVVPEPTSEPEPEPEPTPSRSRRRSPSPSPSRTRSRSRRRCRSRRWCRRPRPPPSPRSR